MHFVMNIKCLRWFGNHSCKNGILRRHLCLSTWLSDYRKNNGLHRNGNFPRSLMLGGRYQSEGDLSSWERFQAILTTCQTITVWNWNINKMGPRCSGPYLDCDCLDTSWSSLCLDPWRWISGFSAFFLSLFPVCLYVLLNKSIFFCIPLLICLFLLVFEDQCLDMIWGTGRDLHRSMLSEHI